MFRLGAKISAMGICCLIALMFLPIFNMSPVSAYDGSDFIVTMDPVRAEFVIGGAAKPVYFYFNLSSDMENEDIYITYAGVANADKVVYTPAPSPEVNPIWEGHGGTTFTYPIMVSLMPDFGSTAERRVDFYFYLQFADNDELIAQVGMSLYIMPVIEGTWSITDYTPDLTMMADNENKQIYITIQNDSSQSKTFNLNPVNLNPGFGVNPSSDTITINPDSSYQWTTTLTCTGYGLISSLTYPAVRWDVTDTSTGISEQAGVTMVTYIGLEPSPIADVSIEWLAESIEIPFGETDNVYIIVRNLGDTPLTLEAVEGDAWIRLTSRAWDPIWPYEVIQPEWSVLGPGENENIRIVFWAHGDPEEMAEWAYITAAIEDNYGNRREISIYLRAIVGTMSLSITPDVLKLQRGETQNVVIRVTNNENANRTYIITAAEETTSGIYWARSEPSVENIALTPLTSRDVTIKVTATAPSDGIYPYNYYVHCEQTGSFGRVEISIEIVTLPTGTYAQQFPSLLLMLAPLTGSIEASGYIMSVVVILIFIMIGLAMTGGIGGTGGPLGTIILTVFAITLVSALGWFPAWIMGLTILILALGMARWMHEYF